MKKRLYAVAFLLLAAVAVYWVASAIGRRGKPPEVQGEALSGGVQAQEEALPDQEVGGAKAQGAAASGKRAQGPAATGFMNDEIRHLGNQEWDTSPLNEGWRKFVDQRIAEASVGEEAAKPYVERYVSAFADVKSMRIQGVMSTREEYDGIPANATLDVEYIVTLDPFCVHETIKGDGIQRDSVAANGRYYRRTNDSGKETVVSREWQKYAPAAHPAIAFVESLDTW